MSEMIERVARALCAEAGENWDASNFNETASGCEPEEARQGWLSAARAAIAAMREPTEEMVTKAWQLLNSNLRYEEAYRHLIDSALKEEK